MAANRAKDPAVKRLGEQMATDHTRMQNEWIQMASSNGMPLEPVMGKLHWQKVNHLRNESGKEFDRVYLSTIADHNQAVLSYLQKEGRAAHSPQVRQLVGNDIPTWQQDMTLAQQAGNQIGVDVNDNGRVTLKNGGKVKAKSQQ